ncbi:hypothetical protein C8R47DRAFT_381733 [Mycena vitilis]|nr:hypothetical protein C8R47DRAFT_381733 [Mycena vitilis]
MFYMFALKNHKTLYVTLYGPFPIFLLVTAAAAPATLHLCTFRLKLLAISPHINGNCMTCAGVTLASGTQRRHRPGDWGRMEFCFQFIRHLSHPLLAISLRVPCDIQELCSLVAVILIL